MLTIFHNILLLMLVLFFFFFWFKSIQSIYMKCLIAKLISHLSKIQFKTSLWQYLKFSKKKKWFLFSSAFTFIFRMFCYLIQQVNLNASRCLVKDVAYINATSRTDLTRIIASYLLCCHSFFCSLYIVSNNLKSTQSFKS